MEIWQIVKYEEGVRKKLNELREAKMTMIKNFGRDGKCRAGLIKREDRLAQMIIDVFEYYENRLKL